MGNFDSQEQYGILSIMQDQLDKIIIDSQNLDNEDDVIYYHAIKKLIDFKLNEDEVKRQFKDFQDVIISTARMDFSKRIRIENEKDLFSYIACGLNMLNEELEGEVMPKEIHELMMEHVIIEKPDYVILTNASAKIIYTSKSCEDITGCLKDQLLHQDIQHFFVQNVHFINDVSGKIKNAAVSMVCSDSSLVPVVLSVHEIHCEKNNHICHLYIFKKKGAE